MCEFILLGITDRNCTRWLSQLSAGLLILAQVMIPCCGIAPSPGICTQHGVCLSLSLSNSLALFSLKYIKSLKKKLHQVSCPTKETLSAANKETTQNNFQNHDSPGKGEWVPFI